MPVKQVGFRLIHLEWEIPNISINYHSGLLSQNIYWFYFFQKTMIENVSLIYVSLINQNFFLLLVKYIKSKFIHLKNIAMSGCVLQNEVFNFLVQFYYQVTVNLRLVI